MSELAHLERALLEWVTFGGVATGWKALVAEGQILGRNRHELHREGKHHQNHENADNTKSLRRAISATNSEKLEAEEIDADLDDTVQSADEHVNKHGREETGVKEKLHVKVLLVVRRQA